MQYDLNTGCKIVEAPSDTKRWAGIVPLPGGKVLVEWFASEAEALAFKAGFNPIDGATQYVAHDTKLSSCATAGVPNAKGMNQGAVEAISTEAAMPEDCLAPGEVFVAPPATPAAITLALFDKAAAGLAKTLAKEKLTTAAVPAIPARTREMVIYNASTKVVTLKLIIGDQVIPPMATHTVYVEDADPALKATAAMVFEPAGAMTGAEAVYLDYGMRGA